VTRTPDSTETSAHHGVPFSAEVRETHTAALFFAADRVYKMKKPVDLGFCDFTTVERRRDACEREVRLNRRLSPDAYLGVSQVLAPDGRVAEHLVVMRRMSPRTRLARLVREGEPVDDHLRAIARLLAAFHAGAHRGPEVDAEGTVIAAGRRWHGVHVGLRRFAGTLLDADVVDEVCLSSTEFLAGRDALFTARIAAGRILDGHGDLLADDIFCLPDGPRVLDCLEFDDRLRFVDGLDDAAFLAMDLEHLGSRELAERFLELYAEFGADPAPVALHHHHVAYRAAVRAMVTCLRADQGGGGADDARSLLGLAAEHLAAGRVRLVLVGGLPGTGKTTVAGGLADALGMTVLSSDRIRKELAGLDPLAPAGAGYREDLYALSHTDATYAEMLRRAADLLARGESVVLDASWTSSHRRTAAVTLAERTHSRFTALRCTAPAAVTSTRITSRRGSASDATPLVAAVMCLDADPWVEAHTVDTSGGPEESIAAAVAAVHDRRSVGSWTEVRGRGGVPLKRTGFGGGSDPTETEPVTKAGA